MPILSNADFGKPVNNLGVFENLAKAGGTASQKCINLFEDTDFYVRQIKIPKVSDLTFIADGVPFQARNTPRGQVADLHIWAILGYLPYSVTSQKKRIDLITILEAARALPTIRFGIDDKMRIVVSCVYEIPNPPTPNYIFEPLVRFLQEARPFMALIGEHL